LASSQSREARLVTLPIAAYSSRRPKPIVAQCHTDAKAEAVAAVVTFRGQQSDGVAHEQHQADQ
jgi:hypothetical protein